jgi:hypothetical protein
VLLLVVVVDVLNVSVVCVCGVYLQNHSLGHHSSPPLSGTHQSSDRPQVCSATGLD